MLDEMPVLQPLTKPKLLAAHPAVIESLPFIDSKISFQPFIKSLKSKRRNINGTKDRLYNFLINKFETITSIEDDLNESSLLEHHADLMELLTTSLFPVVGREDQNNYAFASPYQFRVFYYSEPFRKLFFDSKEQYLLLPDGLPTEELRNIQCASIYEHVLQQFYGIHLNEDRHLIYPVTNDNTGLTKYYKIGYDRRFIELELKGKLPPIKDCAVCLNTFRILDLDKQLETMPLNLFQAKGFAIWMAEDVTTSESLEILKKVLLRETCGTGVINELKTAVKALTGISGIDVGIIPFVSINGQVVPDDETISYGLMPRQWLNGNPESTAHLRGLVEFFKENPLPVPLSILDESLLEIMPDLDYMLKQGYKSYLIYPMQNSDGIIGLLELASKEANVLHHEVIMKLEPAIPLLSLAMLKCRDNFENRIEKLIMNKFTALQGPVEWKFAEVAFEHLRSNGKSDLSNNIVFDHVYPLYGAIDIRNSSIERTRAIQQDMKQHLVLISGILDNLYALIKLPLIEGLAFKNESIMQSIQDNLTAEDEVRINEFLDNEVEPLFMHLQNTNSEARRMVEEYYRMVEQPDSLLYVHRRNYENSVASINNSIISFLEKEEEEIQNSYPHYFEKYRTDGVEYNIYIGQSICPDKPFDLLYLKNIRLWQLRSMAEVARITKSILPSLKVPLQTTQLILIHNLPISIGFRRDERKFDVEGSYNIKYEIIKKRLDKALVKGTGERLTQPNKISMVYSNQKDAVEYEEYIRFLQKKNILKEGCEVLELEELQAVKGLRALRVEINLQSE